MEKQVITVEELVRMIEKGKLRLPEMQRPRPVSAAHVTVGRSGSTYAPPAIGQ
jgi:hypothetical protein